MPVATAVSYFPILGMLMIPKTICYILIVRSFYRYNKEKRLYVKKTGLTFLLIPAVMIIMAFSLLGCGMKKMDGDGMVREPFYAQISQDEAKLMMKDDDGHVIVDVRRADEYAQGHIPGAILIPNEEIGTEPPEELPDKNQIILVYCRTGRRSKEASQKLAEMGYVNVYEFGGIEDWTGDIVTDDANGSTDGKTVSLS